MITKSFCCTEKGTAEKITANRLGMTQGRKIMTEFNNQGHIDKDDDYMKQGSIRKWDMRVRKREKIAD